MKTLIILFSGRGAAHAADRGGARAGECFVMPHDSALYKNKSFFFARRTFFFLVFLFCVVVFC